MSGQGERLPDDMPNVGDVAEVTPKTFTGVATGPLMRSVPGGVAEFRQKESGLPPVRAQLGGEEFWGQLVQPGYGTAPKPETKTGLTPEEKTRLEQNKLDDVQQKAEERMEDVEFLYEDLQEARRNQISDRFNQNIQQLDPNAGRQKPAGMPSGEGKPEFPKQKLSKVITPVDSRPTWIAGVKGKEPVFDYPQPIGPVGILKPTFIDDAAKDVKNFSDTWKSVGTMFFGPTDKVKAGDYTPQTEAEYIESRTKQRNSLDTLGKAVWDFYDSTSKWMKGFSDENLYLWESQGGPNSSDPAFGPKYFENVKNLLNIVKNPKNIQHQDYGNLQWLAVFNMHQLFEQFGYPALIPQTVMTVGRDLGNAFKGIGGPTWDKSGNPVQDVINLSVWGLGNAGIKTYNATLGNLVGKIKNDKTIKDSQFAKDLEKLKLNNIVEDLRKINVREGFGRLKEAPTLRDQKAKLRELKETEIRNRLTPKRFPRGSQELAPTLVDTPPIMNIEQYEKEQDEEKGYQPTWDRDNEQDRGQGTTLTTIGKGTPILKSKEDLDPSVVGGPTSLPPVEKGRDTSTVTASVPVDKDGNVVPIDGDENTIVGWQDRKVEVDDPEGIAEQFGERAGSAYKAQGDKGTDEEREIYGNKRLELLNAENDEARSDQKHNWKYKYDLEYYNSYNKYHNKNITNIRDQKLLNKTLEHLNADIKNNDVIIPNDLAKELDWSKFSEKLTKFGWTEVTWKEHVDPPFFKEIEGKAESELTDEQIQKLIDQFDPIIYKDVPSAKNFLNFKLGDVWLEMPDSANPPMQMFPPVDPNRRSSDDSRDVGSQFQNESYKKLLEEQGYKSSGESQTNEEANEEELDSLTKTLLRILDKPQYKNGKPVKNKFDDRLINNLGNTVAVTLTENMKDEFSDKVSERLAEKTAERFDNVAFEVSDRLGFKIESMEAKAQLRADIIAAKAGIKAQEMISGRIQAILDAHEDSINEALDNLNSRLSIEMEDISDRIGDKVQDKVDP